MRQVETEKSIRQIVRSSVEAYANGFEARHIGEVDNPNGTINMKIHNVFIAALEEETQYYTALVRSLDSSLGNMLEKMAINIAKLFYKVEKSVEGNLYPEQTAKIAEFLEAYKNNKSAKLIQKFLKQPADVIATILLGNEFVNVTISALGTTLILEFFPIFTFVIIVCGIYSLNEQQDIKVNSQFSEIAISKYIFLN